MVNQTLYKNASCLKTTTSFLSIINNTCIMEQLLPTVKCFSDSKTSYKINLKFLCQINFHALVSCLRSILENFFAKATLQSSFTLNFATLGFSFFSRESDSRDRVVRPFVSNVSNTLTSIDFNHQTTLIINRL